MVGFLRVSRSLSRGQGWEMPHSSHGVRGWLVQGVSQEEATLMGISVDHLVHTLVLCKWDGHRLLCGLVALDPGSTLRLQEAWLPGPRQVPLCQLT